MEDEGDTPTMDVDEAAAIESLARNLFALRAAPIPRSSAAVKLYKATMDIRKAMWEDEIEKDVWRALAGDMMDEMFELENGDAERD